MTRPLSWYARRLRQMSLEEIAGRGVDATRRLAWARLQVAPGHERRPPASLLTDRLFTTPLPDESRDRVPGPARERLLAAAGRLMTGDWVLLGTSRPDILDPDWFWDPVTGRSAPQHKLAFRVDHRNETETGNVKAVWELSRHHHLTVLAAAWWLTRDDSYAEIVDRQLRSWWSANPFLSGVHWTSGIELGVRLTSWAWVRRLLHDWPKIGDLFDANEDALRQIWWHQRYLAAFPSRGSSANNHVVAEASGRLVAACAFPWYGESERWRADAARQLQRELRANTFPDGVNRELATDYHRFVAELGLVAAAEAAAAGHPLDRGTWALLASTMDAAAAMLDSAGRPPRQGDGDEGRALVLDDPDDHPWGQLLALGSALVGAQPWWPASQDTVGSIALGALAGAPPELPERPTTAPNVFPDAGITLLRSPPADGPEIWCRCDGGPHGFLSIAAHAHADALSVEVRYDGTEVLVDPGTYCYHGEPAWRSYFRSTLAHNTIEVDGENQSVEAGPFMWSTKAPSQVTRSDVGERDIQRWTARHTGYARLDRALRHERTVTLERSSRKLTVSDVLHGGGHTVRLAFHLGPDVTVDVEGSLAQLSWDGATGEERAAMYLPTALQWRSHRGETDPVLGWHSPRFGERVPTTTLVGSGALSGGLELVTSVVFARC